MKLKIFFFVWVLLVVPLISVFSQSSILISEVFYDTPGIDSKEEWIELYNTGSGDISLGSSWYLHDNYSSFSLPDVIINSHSCIIIARNNQGFHDLYGFSPDVSGLSLNLGNSGDFLKLFSGTEEIDSVAWEGSIPGWDVYADRGYSIARKLQILDASYPADWESNSLPSPGYKTVVPEPATVILLGGGLLGLSGLRRRYG